MVATALVPVFDGKENQKKRNLEISKGPKDPKPGDEMEPPRETVETVDVYWGDRLEEKQFALQGSWTNHVMNLKWFPGRLAMGMNLLCFGMKMNMLMKTRKNPKNGVHDAGDEPPDPDAQLHQEIEQLSAPLKVRHVTLMEPIMLRGVQHVMPVMGGIMTRMKYMGIWVNRIPSDRAKELLASKFSVMGCQPKCSSILYCWGWPSKQRPL